MRYSGQLFAQCLELLFGELVGCGGGQLRSFLKVTGGFHVFFEELHFAVGDEFVLLGADDEDGNMV